MIFAGIQKMTLLDFPDTVACTLFTAGCNFACPYCHNRSLIATTDAAGASVYSTVTDDYVFDFLHGRTELLDGVCISGGEPLMQEDICHFARKVKDMGFLVKIDTNGSFPGRLRKLVETGCADYIAMDVKNTPEKYLQTAGTAECDITAIRESIDFLLTGKVPYEFRTTVVRDFHTADDLLSIARFITGAKKYYLQTFTGPERALQAGLSAYNNNEMRQLLQTVSTVMPCVELR